MVLACCSTREPKLWRSGAGGQPLFRKCARRCKKMFMAAFDSSIWREVPFHFWSVTFFIFGCVVGSFLNVCIYRMPREESLLFPASHCPHCNYSIPWYLNIPLFTWLFLRGRCAHCQAPISARYFFVELL